MSKLLIATDAELFVAHPNGTLTSIAGILGADKYHKKPITDDVRLQEDNVLLEFDINPHSEKTAFMGNIARAMDISREEAGKLGFDVVDRVCSHIYTPTELASFHKDAFVFGCDPDFNALSGAMNPKPTATNAGLRTAGAHVHFGYEGVAEITQQSRQIIGVMCDYLLGLPSLILDTDTRRRELYGKAGAVRWKPYGVEYRTLSNFWLFDEANRAFVWEQAQKAFNHFVTNSFQELVAIVSPEQVQQAINNGDAKLAEQFIKQLKVA